MSAAAGALGGLLLGIVLGRATVSAPAPVAIPKDTSTSESALTPTPREVPDLELEKGDEFRVLLGRKTPRGKDGAGFERQRSGARPVARLASKESTLHFDIEATPGEYMLTAVLGVEGGKGGNLEAKWDGKSVGTWALAPGWGMYGSIVPRELLGPERHELVFAQGLPDGVSVNADSVAVYPVSDVAQFSIGPEAVGHLVDGFGSFEGKSVWSYGAQSTIGVALVPAAKPYRMTVRGSALPALAPMTVAVKVNGNDVGSADFTEKAGDATWSVPAKAVKSGINRIEFSYPKTARPSELNPASKDSRPLAIRLSRFELSPE